MSKYVKNLLVDTIRDRIGEVRDLLVIDSSRLDGDTSNRLRLELRGKSFTALTVRNSLAKRALNDLGISSLDSFLNGPTTLIWGGEDIVALSKEIARWAKEIDSLDIRGGTTEGTTLSAGDVKELSKSPGREELIGQIVGMALSPGAQLAALVLAPGGVLAGQLKTLSHSGEE